MALPATRTRSARAPGWLASVATEQSGNANRLVGPPRNMLIVLVPGEWILNPVGTPSARASVQHTPCTSTCAPNQLAGTANGSLRRMFTT